ncbi:hypothetical protein ZWY2020_039683 [Hordeum vulgare]|nr:hypothetical protein ZWY2020_039683 [Hordeum vulgare]
MVSDARNLLEGCCTAASAGVVGCCCALVLAVFAAVQNKCDWWTRWCVLGAAAAVCRGEGLEGESLTLKERLFLMEQEVGRECRLVTIEAHFAGANGAAGSTKNAVVLKEMGDTIAAAGAHYAVKESLGNDDMRRGDVEPEKSGEDSAEKDSAGSEKEYNITVAEVERLSEELESLKRKVGEIQAGKETAEGETREKDAQTAMFN